MIPQSANRQIEYAKIMTERVNEYLAKTGQTFQELMAGSVQYGSEFILTELVEQALQQHKKIVWIPHLIEGTDVGLLNYVLEPC